ncbi:tRNA (N6-isopentenyl adenosine(37)-C2)-methylthiotransferase MiaB [Enterobacteriaceae endosymbiont of Macroplea appendiculata]|uniref:tRNA (N6-isopentenyl adenosine(37)-C2)-methylthiotransferase MiaB n=1 Tax=Enterobacteriaceae endosymbiont of Macroplea appendiculata TaxID=2675790 RepID=UPI0014490BD5|nr:tRNA (N6-isopentenyl adenosine(37)-C2)-methylthiotransferase MiaB [Enterobacteriaceae endosymbiont of Macroplea appendiculata]QJC30905.1 tRNA (N6-isopentenyl adenosine(37)-C2)-methylthiotransferase MiaB [Enterobacteriaceae endosymbiont of Macroplea appendiculata]
MSRNKVYIKTWGCQMNTYDSTKLSHYINKELNFAIVTIAKHANIFILNTCSIREKAQEKLFHQLGRWKIFKQNNPNIIICVGGCVAAQEGEKIFKRASYVDIIFGPQTIHRLPKMIQDVYNFKKKLIDISFPKTEKFNYLPVIKTTQHTSYVTIIEGCNKYCTYCIVPFTRGKEISRPYKDILLEIQQLIIQGIKEIHLLGQNVNSYKYIDIDNNIITFDKLLIMISNIKGIYRIRYTTSNPQDFTQGLINVYGKIPQLVNFLHLPVQSGSEKILSLMKRRYSLTQYKNIIYQLKKIRPNIHISSDFIVGFPGETQEDFNQTIQLILDMDIDMSYSFIYSARPGTIASKMVDNVSLQEKKRRLYILQDYIQQQTKKFSSYMLHSIQTVLVEGISKHNQFFFGKTENNRIVFFKSTYNCVGKIVKVYINNFYLYTLYATFVSMH